MIKLVLLKSGEEVISQIDEMVVNEKVVGYFFKLPAAVKLYKDTEYSIKLTPWMPLSKDEIIPVVTDWVISIVEPVDRLKEMYVEGLKKHEDRKSASVDSPESDSGDTD